MGGGVLLHLCTSTCIAVWCSTHTLQAPPPAPGPPAVPITLNPSPAAAAELNYTHTHTSSHHTFTSQPAVLTKRDSRCEAESSVCTRRTINPQQAPTTGHCGAQSFPQHRAHSCSSDSSASHGLFWEGMPHCPSIIGPHPDTTRTRSPPGAPRPAATQRSIATASRANCFPVTRRTSPMSQPHSRHHRGGCGTGNLRDNEGILYRARTARSRCVLHLGQLCRMQHRFPSAQPGRSHSLGPHRTAGCRLLGVPGVGAGGRPGGGSRGRQHREFALPPPRRQRSRFPAGASERAEPQGDRYGGEPEGFGSVPRSPCGYRRNRTGPSGRSAPSSARGTPAPHGSPRALGAPRHSGPGPRPRPGPIPGPGQTRLLRPLWASPARLKSLHAREAARDPAHRSAPSADAAPAPVPAAPASRCGPSTQTAPQPSPPLAGGIKARLRQWATRDGAAGTPLPVRTANGSGGLCVISPAPREAAYGRRRLDGWAARRRQWE